MPARPTKKRSDSKRAATWNRSHYKTPSHKKDGPGMLGEDGYVKKGWAKARRKAKEKDLVGESDLAGMKADCKKAMAKNVCDRTTGHRDKIRVGLNRKKNIRKCRLILGETPKTGKYAVCRPKSKGKSKGKKKGKAKGAFYMKSFPSVSLAGRKNGVINKKPTRREEEEKHN